MRKSLIERLKETGKRTALAGVLGNSVVLSGCGIGAYSKDPRAGTVADAVIGGFWDAVVAEEGKTEVNVNPAQQNTQNYSSVQPKAIYQRVNLLRPNSLLAPATMGHFMVYNNWFEFRDPQGVYTTILPFNSILDIKPLKDDVLFFPKKKVIIKTLDKSYSFEFCDRDHYQVCNELERDSNFRANKTQQR